MTAKRSWMGMVLLLEALMGAGVVMAVAAFSDGHLTRTGLSVVTGGAFAVLTIGMIVFARVSRYVMVVALVITYVGLFFVEQLGNVVGRFWWLAQNVEPVGLSAGATVGLLMFAFGAVLTCQFTRRSTTVTEDPNGPVIDVEASATGPSEDIKDDGAGE